MRARHWFAASLALVAILAAVKLVPLTWFAFSPAQSGATTSIYFDVRKGDTGAQIAKELFSRKIISDDVLFLRLGRLTRQWNRIKAGEYALSPSMTPWEVFSVITSGISVVHPITVREGENLYEIADDIELKGLGLRNEFVRLCKDPAFMAQVGFTAPFPPSLEGYLFPDTYHFNHTMTLPEMIRQMVKRFRSVWTAEHDRKAARFRLTQHQVVTLASIIEKETGAPQDRTLISSVFHNRLKKRMRLQSDPTIIYGIWERYDGNIRRADIRSQTPYNTYVISALPIGPISNPGKLAIEAALDPAVGEFLYFVSRNDGTTAFTRTLAEHSNEVRRFQLNRGAREGKSWRNLGKETPAPSTQ